METIICITLTVTSVLIIALLMWGVWELVENILNVKK